MYITQSNKSWNLTHHYIKFKSRINWDRETQGDARQEDKINRGDVASIQRTETKVKETMCGSTRKKKQTTELSTREMEINAVVGRKRGSVKINERGRETSKEDEKTKKRGPSGDETRRRPLGAVNYWRTLKNPSAPRVIPRAGEAVSAGRISMTNTGRTSRGRGRSYLDFIPAEINGPAYKMPPHGVVTRTRVRVDMGPPRTDTGYLVQRKPRARRCGRIPPPIFFIFAANLRTRAKARSRCMLKANFCTLPQSLLLPAFSYSNSAWNIIFEKIECITVFFPLLIANLCRYILYMIRCFIFLISMIRLKYLSIQLHA